MKNFNFGNFSACFFCILILVTALFNGCDYPDTYQPKGDYISGYAVFADTNFITSSGYYAVALYSCQGSPMTSIPIKTDTIKMDGLTNPYYWRIGLDQKENCFLAIVWKESSSLNEIPVVLGTYGCDTSHYCTEHKVIAFPNYTGANYNILCWADTTKRLN
jgi:hypothetical protein